MEWTAYLRIGFIVAVYLLGPFFIIWLYKRYKALSKVGTIVLAYALGIILSLSGIMDDAWVGDAVLVSWQSTLQTLCVPLAIPLMLFSADFKTWTRSLKKTFVAFFCGVVAITCAVFLAYTWFKGLGIPELDKAAGLMMGFYTGGTPNVASLNIALHPSSETFIMVNTFEIFITFFLLAFLVGGGFKLVRKVLRYLPDELVEHQGGAGQSRKMARTEKALASSVGTEASDFENYDGLFTRPVLKKLLLPFGCSLGIFALAGLLSLWLVPKDYQVVSVILVITTLAIALSFWKRLRNTPKMFELGMYFILVFSIIIASDFSVAEVGSGAYGLMGFIAVILVTTLLIHLILAKICRVDADLFTISAVGLIFSPPFVPTVASQMKSRRCLLSGIVVGLLGYAVGNYLGVGMYYVLNSVF